MKRRNKITIAFLLIAMLCCLFAGCGKDEQPTLQEEGKVVKTAMPSICTGRYNKTVNNSDVTADFCSCNNLGVILDKTGSTTEIDRHTIAVVPEKTFADFDRLGELYETFMDGYTFDAFKDEKLTTESEKYGAYTAFTEQLRNIFSGSEFDAAQEVKYDIKKGVLVGINKSFTIAVDDTYNYSDRLFIVSELFGYKSKETFGDYAKKLVAAYIKEQEETVEKLRLSLDGAIYTESGSYIMPYVVKSAQSDAFIVCLFMTKDGFLSAWVGDMENAADAVDLNDEKGATTFFMYGRCSLFETSSGYYQFSVSGDKLPAGKYVTMKLSTTNDTIPDRTITIMLLPEYAPKSVENFLSYVEAGFFDGTVIHRIVKNGCLQGGGYVYKNGYRTKKIPEGMKEIEGEFTNNGHPENVIGHCPGVISMARGTGANTGTSQFFLCFDYYQSWDGQYAGFGFMPYQEDIEYVQKLGMTTEINGSEQPSSNRITIKEVKVFDVENEQ